MSIIKKLYITFYYKLYKFNPKNQTAAGFRTIQKCNL